MPETNGKRNIDERLDALTMNLELLSHSVAAHDSQIDKLTEAILKLVEVTNQDATSIRTLARIVEAHEQRIAAIEKG